MFFCTPTQSAFLVGHTLERNAAHVAPKISSLNPVFSATASQKSNFDMSEKLELMALWRPAQVSNGSRRQILHHFNRRVRNHFCTLKSHVFWTLQNKISDFSAQSRAVSLEPSHEARVCAVVWRYHLAAPARRSQSQECLIRGLKNCIVARFCLVTVCEQTPKAMFWSFFVDGK